MVIIDIEHEPKHAQTVDRQQDASYPSLDVVLVEQAKGGPYQECWTQ
jgi:hypothetical protein